MVGLRDKLKLRVPIVEQLLAGDRNPDAESLHETEVSHDFSHGWIAIVRDARLAEGLNRHLSEGATGVLDFNAITEPSNPGGCIGRFIVSMHNRIARQLLECR